MALLLNQMSGMPQMEAAFGGWMQIITVQILSQALLDGFVTESSQNYTFQGTVQPLSAEAINQKPEGQRSWQWLHIHAITSTYANLNTNDRIVYNGVTYKVMAVKDYSLNNFMEYHVVKDFDG